MVYYHYKLAGKQGTVPCTDEANAIVLAKKDKLEGERTPISIMDGDNKVLKNTADLHLAIA